MTRLAKPVRDLIGDSQATLSFKDRNEKKIRQLNLIMRKRGWYNASHMFLEMVIVAERDSEYARQFQSWLDKEGTTLLLWDLTSRFLNQYKSENEHFDAKAGIDAASAILSPVM